MSTLIARIPIPIPIPAELEVPLAIAGFVLMALFAVAFHWGRWLRHGAVAWAVLSLAELAPRLSWGDFRLDWYGLSTSATTSFVLVWSAIAAWRWKGAVSAAGAVIAAAIHAVVGPVLMLAALGRLDGYDLRSSIWFFTSALALLGAFAIAHQRTGSSRSAVLAAAAVGAAERVVSSALAPLLGSEFGFSAAVLVGALIWGAAAAGLGLAGLAWLERGQASAEAVRPEGEGARVGPEVPSPAVSAPQAVYPGAIPVPSVDAEYAHLRAQPCSCGGGWELQLQAKLNTPELGPRYVVDKLTTRCGSCGTEASFLFEIDMQSPEYQREMAETRALFDL